MLYDDQGRYADALPIVRQMIERGFFSSDPTFPVLMGSQKAGLIDAAESFNDSYKVLQASSSSAAAEAVKKLAQRFAAGSGELAELVRKDQDLEVEAAGLDKALIAAVSKAPNERNQASEEEMRKRLAGISAERKKLSDVLAERFPDYVALANPKPLTLQETQDLAYRRRGGCGLRYRGEEELCLGGDQDGCGLDGDPELPPRAWTRRCRSSGSR